ncbi:flagellar hook-length control protein FliK [Neptunomonas sp.]|uniref:flagellar hook-length control protein FliK n=1 Tax=Neptunomonas sp. TaxID=1971898 RepID=UPI00356417FD
MSTITPQSLALLDSTGNSRTASSEKLIPAGGTLQATVKQVSQDQLSPNVFRLKLEANSVLMELKVQQPIAQGSQVTLARSTDGQLSVTINATNSGKTGISGGADKPQNSQTYQTTATPVIRSGDDSSRLNRLIPTGHSISAQVVTQTPGQTTPTLQSQSHTLTPQTNGPQQTSTQPQTTLSQQAQPPLSANTPLQTSAPQIPPNQTMPGPTVPAQTPAQASVTPQALAATSQTTSAAPTTPTPPATAANTQATPAASQTPPSPPISQPAQTPQTASQTPQAPSGTQATSVTRAAVVTASVNTSVTTTAPTQAPLTNQTSLATPTTPTAPTTQAQPQPAATKYNTDPAVNIMTLKITGETITLKTSANLPPLQQVQISRSTNDQLLIRWSQPISSAPTTSALTLTSSQTQTVENSMRELLPQQITLTSGVQQILNSTQASTAGAAGQIDKVVQSLMLLFGVQPGAAEAQQAIKQNIGYGGLFTENKLANQQPPAKDMKQFLGKMQALAGQLPDAQKQVIQTTIEKMLARITSNQLHSLQHRQERVETNERFFQLDLPVQNQNSLENVELRISQRSQKNSRDEPETIWKVRLHFDLEESGSIDAELSLNQEQNEISAAFTCANNDTATFVRSQLESFRTQLTALGLTVPALACRQGEQGPQLSPIQKQLIDIKT